MPSNYQDEDIQAAWNDVFSRDKYRIMISCIADNFPRGYQRDERRFRHVRAR